MDGNKKKVGRPKSENPKMKLDIRIKTSTMIDIEIVSEKLCVTRSALVQMMLEEKLREYKELKKN